MTDPWLVAEEEGWLWAGAAGEREGRRFWGSLELAQQKDVQARSVRAKPGLLHLLGVRVVLIPPLPPSWGSSAPSLLTGI